MIRSHDRSGWFGASDTARIMGNWDTDTFCRWWLEKLGTIHNNFSSRAMAAGTAYEHRILDAIGVRQRDRQIKVRRLRLRVNLDGEDRETIHEVKTYGGERFRVTRAYWQQCQVEMFAARKRCRIVAYKLVEDDYKNFFNPVDLERVSFHQVEYDPEWIKAAYLPRLRYLAQCLRERRTPNVADFERESDRLRAG